MKGYLYYSATDAEQNKLFIEDLQRAANKYCIDLQILIDQDPPEIRDFILFRHRDEQLARKFEENGHLVVNRSAVNRIANHKLRTFELATSLGIPTIPTNPFTTSQQINSFPVIIKTVNGHGGNEVFLVKDAKKATQLLRQFPPTSLIIQPFIESNAQDVRVFVLGNKVIGAVKRTGVDDFKSNFTLGGSIEKFAVPHELEVYALTIAEALRSTYIGIDFLLLPTGQFLLNEIEDPVGARSLYLTHNFSVAEKILQHLAFSIQKKESDVDKK